MKSQQTVFAGTYPGAFYLDIDDLKSLTTYLIGRRWIENDEPIQAVSKPGEGNMNCTVRVKTRKRSFILKQSRPWVEKYPQIAAPVTRARYESQFYLSVANEPMVSRAMPKLLGVDAESFVLCLEDLGDSRDFTFCYRGQEITDNEVIELARYLSALHRMSSKNFKADVFENREMRRLNHEHIFELPLKQNNGLNLENVTQGLAEAANELKRDALYCRQIKKLGELYLKNGSTLLHGDFYPGSWLKTTQNVKIIDPEFCFLGPAEFDVGIFLAHLHLAYAPTAVIERQIAMFSENYRTGYDFNLSLRFAGTEIMRRLIGVAQLPLTRGLDEKRRLLRLSRDLVLR